MQNIVSKLQDIIKTHYGYISEFEWKPVRSYQSIHRESYSTIDKTLSIPIYEPKSQRPIAFFKILNVELNDDVHRERMTDLVQISLQSYINLVDQLDISENLVHYLQLELQPQNVIRLHHEIVKRHEDLMGFQQDTIGQPPPLPATKWEDLVVHTQDPKKALLLKADSCVKIEKLALTIHSEVDNNFFIRTDHMPQNFLNSMNDLIGLDSTTLFIPNIEELSPVQQKTLETYFLLNSKLKDQDLLIIVATTDSVSKMTNNPNISSALLKHFDFFYIFSEKINDAEVRFESLSQCAKAILYCEPTQHFANHKLAAHTKSFSLIPSCTDAYPTVH